MVEGEATARVSHGNLDLCVAFVITFNTLPRATFLATSFHPSSESTPISLQNFLFVQTALIPVGGLKLRDRHFKSIYLSSKECCSSFATAAFDEAVGEVEDLRTLSITPGEAMQFLLVSFLV